MKCVLDTTVNLKQLVSSEGDKLMLPVNGEPLLRHHFRSMSEAGITSLFILIEANSSSRSSIASEAMKFGFSPTFLEIESEVISNRRGLMACEPYMKEAFVYWPVNRILSQEMAKLLVKHPTNSHQVTSILYTGKSHPQLNKNSVFKVEFNSESATRQTGKQTAQGYDIGVYKCGAIIFKLIDKVAKDRPLSWNRIQTALSRAGRSTVIPTVNDHWSVIEANQDIDTLERLQAGETVGKIELNDIDKSVLSKLFESMLPTFRKIPFIQQQGAMLWVLIMILAASTLLFGHWMFTVFAGIVSASVVMTYPLIEYISDEQPLTQRLRAVTLPILRIAILGIFSMAIIQDYGLNLWLLLSVLLITAEVFFILKPVTLYDHKVEQIITSYTIHGAWLLVSCIFAVPTLMLMIFGLLSLSISVTKGQAFYRELKQED